MEVESSGAYAPPPESTASAAAATIPTKDDPQKKSFLEDTPHSQTQIMTVNIDISDDNDTKNETGDGGSVITSNDSTSKSSSNIIGSNGLPRQLNGGLKSSASEIKRIQRTIISEERLTAAWRKWSLKHTWVRYQ